MKLKLDDAGHVVVDDGKPVYVHDDGKEIAFDAAGTVATISRLNGEARGHREAKEAAERALKAFEGLDPAAAKSALDTIKNIDAKKLIDSGEVERVKAEATRAFEDRLKGIEAQIDPLKSERDSYRKALHEEKIGHKFAGSKYIADRLIIPHDLVQSMFGNRFKVEDNGAIVALSVDGKPMLSRANPGNVADFDEALELIISDYPSREKIQKGAVGTGGGSSGGRGGGSRVMTRAQFDKVAATNPAEAASIAAQVRKGELSLVD